MGSWVRGWTHLIAEALEQRADRRHLLLEDGARGLEAVEAKHAPTARAPRLGRVVERRVVCERRDERRHRGVAVHRHGAVRICISVGPWQGAGRAPYQSGSICPQWFQSSRRALLQGKGRDVTPEEAPQSLREAQRRKGGHAQLVNANTLIDLGGICTQRVRELRQ